MYVISSEELDPYIKEEIDSYRKNFNFTVFTVRHSDKYRKLYPSIEEAEFHYNKAHENLFNVLNQSITPRTIVVIPSLGLAKNTLWHYVAPLVAKNHLIIFPVDVQIKDNNLFLVTAIGARNHSEKFTPVQYHQMSLDDSTQMLKARAILAMELAKPYYAENQILQAANDKHLEDIENRAKFAVFIMFFLLGISLLKFLKRVTVRNTGTENLTLRATVVLAEAARLQQERKAREEALNAEKLRREKERKEKQAEIVERTSAEELNQSPPSVLTFSPLTPNTKQRKTRKSSVQEHLGGDEAPVRDHKLAHNFGPQRKKILALLNKWTIDELDLLARFLNNDAQSEIRQYSRKEMLNFLAKFDCGLTENGSGRVHNRVTLPDGVNFMPLLSESNDSKHRGSGHLNGWAFKHLHEAFDNLEITFATVTALIEEKTPQALQRSRRCSAANHPSPNNSV